MSLTIDEFWKPALSNISLVNKDLARRWFSRIEELSTFLEAPLIINEEYSGSADPFTSSIVLIAAPGAVGKSTLARQVAHLTAAIYIDLAKADPVRGNTLSGGLVRSGIFEEWSGGKTALLIDGLDEARLRVTQEAFEAFIDDVVAISNNRPAPTFLFGRSGAIQDAWLFMDDRNVRAPVLEIGYFDHEKSVDFAFNIVRKIKPVGVHEDAERRVLGLLLRKLREQTERDGDRFAGYAPVLQAVARRVAEEENAHALYVKVEKGDEPVTLRAIAQAVLMREQSKLKLIEFDDASLYNKLYKPDEQIARLISRMFGTPDPEVVPMGPADAQRYQAALSSWVGEHPFLDGWGNPSSSVFDAFLVSIALRSTDAGKLAVDREIVKGAAANPFLSEFYLRDHAGELIDDLPADHVGIVYSSLRARLSIGDVASLLFESDDDDLRNPLIFPMGA